MSFELVPRDERKYLAMRTATGSPVGSAEAIGLAALKPQMSFRLCVLDTQIRMG